MSLALAACKQKKERYMFFAYMFKVGEKHFLIENMRKNAAILAEIICL